MIGKNTKFAPVGVINSGRIFHGKAQQQQNNQMIQPSGGMFTSPNFTTPNKVNNDNQGVTKEVHDAFLNLFKGPTNDNVIGGIMQTPSFFDNKHRIRAEPLNNKPSGETPNVQRDAASSRIRDPFVFSPIPNMPQSNCSIFGVRGENNPHSPFNNRGSNEKYTPKKSPITTEKILR